MQQVAELRPVPGIDVIGELPADLQKADSLFRRLSATKAKDAATARALVSFLRSQSSAGRAQAQGHGTCPDIAFRACRTRGSCGDSPASGQPRHAARGCRDFAAEQKANGRQSVILAEGH